MSKPWPITGAICRDHHGVRGIVACHRCIARLNLRPYAPLQPGYGDESCRYCLAPITTTQRQP